MQSWQVRFVCLLGVCVLAFAAGCGSDKKVKDVRGVKVSGRVVLNGQPLKLLPDESILVSFSQTGGIPEDQIGSSAEVKSEDGTFTLEGPTKNGIPAGKYQVTVVSQIYGGGADRFEKLFSTSLPPLVADVGASEGQTFTIDVGKRTVTNK